MWATGKINSLMELLIFDDYKEYNHIENISYKKRDFWINININNQNIAFLYARNFWIKLFFMYF